jgi:hypothetical protein
MAFVFSPNRFQNVCTILGLLTLTWAWAENALALAVGLIDENVPSMRGFKEIPISQRGRLQYLRNALKDVAALEPVQEHGRLLIEHFVTLGSRRNELIHSSRGPDEEGAMAALGFAISARQQKGFQKSFDIPATIALIGEVRDLADEAIHFMDLVGGIFAA